MPADALAAPRFNGKVERNNQYLEFSFLAVVCRDGSPMYRQGIAEGAPEAVQVSDRFNLWQGLSTAWATAGPTTRKSTAAVKVVPT